jgi:histidinol-phosphate aminotransferase
METKRIFRQHILDLPPYKPVYPLDVLSKQLDIPVDDLVKLDANENPYGPLPAVYKALSNLDTYHIYPDPESRKIGALLANYHRIDEENFIIGAGADELIDLILRTMIGPGDKIMTCPPTFSMYAFDGLLNKAEVLSVPRKPDFSVDFERVRTVILKEKPKILFLANPNNPDGSMISDEDFQALDSLPVMIVLDEAYIQFADPGRAYITEVPSRSNLIVLRTFSKWAGLAGLRIGYGVFPKEMVPIIMKAKQPYNVSVAAEAAACATMQHIPEAAERIEAIVAERNKLFDALVELPGISPYPSQANFILCKIINHPAAEVRDLLRRNGVLIRYFNKPGLDDHIRISIGTKEQNQILLTVLRGIFQ